MPMTSPRSSAEQRIVGVGAEDVGARVQLDPPGAVGEIEEGRLAVTATGRKAPRDAVRSSVSSPASSPSWAARTSAIATRPSNSCG